MRAEATPIPKTMKQVWLTAPGTLEVREVPTPRPADGEMLVRTERAGICGSDVHTFRDGHAWLPYPVCTGHEGAGVIEAAGPGTDATRLGQAVYLDPVLSCDMCRYCTSGRRNLCTGLEAVGAHRPGAMADFFVAPASALRPVPEGLTLQAASMLEPLSCAVHAARLAGGVRGLDVVIFGGGTIGLSFLIAAQYGGAARVVITERKRAKRALALARGADFAVDGSFPGSAERVLRILNCAPDLVVDCVATKDSVAEAQRLVARGGAIVVLGLSHDRLSGPIAAVQDSEIRLLGSAMQTPADFAVAERIVQERPGIDSLITAEFPVEQAAAAYTHAVDATGVKVQLVGGASLPR